MRTRYDLGVHCGLVGIAVVAIAGCGRPHMEAPSDIGTDKVEYRTAGRNGDESEGEDAIFEFGPYKVSGVKRNLTVKGGFESFDGFEPAKKRGFSFKLEDGSKRDFQGKCAERAPKETEELDGTITIEEEDPSLACTCRVSGKKVSELFVEDLAGEYGGPFLVGGAEARVIGGYKLDNGDRLAGRPAGYRVEDESGAVAAAGVLPGESYVWLRNGLNDPDRGRIVCGLVGLMLWVPPPPPEPEKD